MPGRRRLVLAAAAGGFAAIVPAALRAQAFPSRAVHLIVPFAAGGSGDVISRLVGQFLSQRWGQPVIIETKPGAGSVVGSAYVAKAPPDGHTILFISNSFVINAKLRPDLPYDGMKAFEPVANMVNSPQVIAVNAASPYQTFKDWLTDARARPGAVSIGALGPAAAQHIASEMLQRVTETKLLYVPFNGGAPAVNALLGGHVNLVLANYTDMAGQLESGKLRALAVTTRERIDALKAVPTVAEQGFPGFEAVAWFGITAPAGTPRDAIAKLSDGFRAAIADPELRQRLVAMGVQPAYMDARGFAAHIADQYVRYSRVIDDGRIKAE